MSESSDLQKKLRNFLNTGDENQRKHFPPHVLPPVCADSISCGARRDRFCLCPEVIGSGVRGPAGEVVQLYNGAFLGSPMAGLTPA